jgi:hypothetical protein
MFLCFKDLIDLEWSVVGLELILMALELYSNGVIRSESQIIDLEFYF